jgi:hypothetical protein
LRLACDLRTFPKYHLAGSVEERLMSQRANEKVDYLEMRPGPLRACRCPPAPPACARSSAWTRRLGAPGASDATPLRSFPAACSAYAHAPWRSCRPQPHPARRTENASAAPCPNPRRTVARSPRCHPGTCPQQSPGLDHLPMRQRRRRGHPLQLRTLLVGGRHRCGSHNRHITISQTKR